MNDSEKLTLTIKALKEIEALVGQFDLGDMRFELMTNDIIDETFKVIGETYEIQINETK